MALLIKRPSSPYYYARFQVNGKDLWLSTKQTDRKEAKKELTRLVAQHRKEISIEEQLKVLTDLIAELPPDQQLTKRQEVVRALVRGQDQKLEIAKAWERWGVNPNKDYDPKPKTILGYSSIWTRFAVWAEARKIKFLHELTAGDSEAYAADLWKSKVSPSTYNQHIKFLRSLFTALETEAGLVTNPWARIISTKKSLGGGRRNLTIEELQNVLAKAEGSIRHMVIVGLFTGLRLADVVNLKVDNVEFNPFPPNTGPRPGFLIVKPKKTERVNKIVEVPLHSSVATLLTDLKQKRKEGFLFPDQQSLHAKDPSRITVLIQNLFESCGIKTTEEIGEEHRRRAIVRVGFHSLRHTFVSLCAKAGAPLHIVQKLVGHGNPMLTSDKYLHLDLADKRAAIAGLPSFGLTKKAKRPKQARKASNARTRIKVKSSHGLKAMSEENAVAARHSTSSPAEQRLLVVPNVASGDLANP
jgi:integrase